MIAPQMLGNRSDPYPFVYNVGALVLGNLVLLDWTWPKGYDDMALRRD